MLLNEVIRCLGVYVSTLLLTAHMAAAHDLHLDRGTVTVDAHRVAISIQQNVDALWHRPATRPEQRTAENLHARADTYLRELQNGLILRDHDGTRLALRKANSAYHETANQFHFDLTYSLPNETRLLLFQYRPHSPVYDRRQIVLAVRGGGQEGSFTVSLTSGANVEFVELASNGDRVTVVCPPLIDPTAADCRPFERRGVSRFHEIVVGIQRRNDEWIARVHVPLALLDTWGHLDRKDQDWLSNSEQSAASNELKSFLRSALTLDHHSRSLAPELTGLVLRGLSNASPPHRGQAALSMWVGRLEAELRWPAEAPARIRWSKFNSAVLQVRLVAARENGCVEHILSTYSPTAELQ